MKSERFYKMLGLSQRAGQVHFGEGAVKDRIKDKKAEIVIVSEDASENTKKKFMNSCNFYSVPYFEYGDRYSLGRATGREFAVVLAVTNKGLAENLVEIMNEL